ncbi:hypothetical protein Tco_0869662 [Tanacetum coccineum]
MQTTHVEEDAALIPYESPLPRVHSLRSDKGSLSLNELTVLYTLLSKKRAKVVIYDAEEDEEDPSKQGRSLIEELAMDAGISFVPPHVADQGRRRRKVSTASELVSTASVKAKDKGKAVMQESEPPKKIKKRVQVQISITEELAQKVLEEEQATFNAEQEAKFKAEQEQERIDHETAMKIQEELDAAERQRMA